MTTTNTDSEPADPLPGERERWTQLGYGLFLHFGINTFDGKGWGEGTTPALDFAPANLNCNQWIEMAAEAGMRYAVLTAKHHDGFCLWPTRQTEYCVRNASVPIDVVGQFTEACRRFGLEAGLYYSLWDRNCPFYEDDAGYAEYMCEQIGELLSNYGPILQLWFDGGWDKDYPTRQWAYNPEWRETEDPEILAGKRWHWKSLYDRIHELQPTCLVTNNNGSDRPGDVRYFPVDFRTAEHFDFVFQGCVHSAIVEGNVMNPVDGSRHWLPLEYCTTLNPDWFWSKDRYYSHPSAATIADWWLRARSSNSNLLLNAGPDNRGLLPEYHREYLRQARRLFER